MKRHNDIPTAHNIPPKIARHEPIPNIIDPTENEQFLQDIQQQELTDMFSSQFGHGLTQMTPANENVPQELRDFFRDEQPWGTDLNLRQVYIRNFHRIRDSETNHRRSRTFLRYLRHDRAPLIETIAQALEDIFRRQSNAFKVNLSFSFILQHRETGEYRYFYASNNQQFLKSPKLIRNQQDLDNLLDFLASQDFPSHLKDQRPNTKWVIERIVSLRIHLVMTTYPLGNSPKLPVYIKNNRYIIGLEKDEHTAKTYKDHLCFFRCLAIGKYKFTRHNCNRKAEELFDQYCEHFEVNPRDFKGVELTDFPKLEKYYETRLFAMFLKEDGTAKTLYLSQASFPSKIYMNVYHNHLSYITDIKMYSKQFICNRCGKLSTRMLDSQRHETKCDGTVDYAYPGGVYKNKLSVFEELEEMGVRVQEEDKYEKWFACYDFEAYQRDFREGFDQVEELDSEEGTSWNKMHVPVSFSVGCNLEGVKTVHVSSKDPEELTAKLVDTLLEMADKKYRAAVERFEYIFEQINDLMQMERDNLSEMNGDMMVSVAEFLDNAGDEDLEMDENGGLTSKHMKSLENLYGKFEGYCKELAVFGFNSAGYDIKLIKKYLFKELCEHGEQPNFTVKKAGKYPCIKTEHLKFMDILQFLAPGYNLKSFFKAFGVREQKGFFPYDYFTHADQLDETTLPPYETFYSTIKGCNVLEEDYATFQKLIDQGKSEQEALQALRLPSKPKTGPENYQWLQQLWDENQWSTFADYLKWYNDLDVTPMIQAIENMNEFYKNIRIDFIHQAISIPGVAMRVCFNSITDPTAEFHLFNPKNKDIYHLFKENIVGGPSIIFNRYHETGKTFIRNNPNKPCQKIIGYDANALYLWAIGQNFPAGYPLIRRQEKFFVREFPQFSGGCRDWIDWLIHERNIEIQSAFHGGEKKIGPYRVDGFCQNLNTIFEFYGDYWHCHPDQFPDENAVHPTVKDKDNNPMTVKDIRTRDHQRVQNLQDKGYNVEIIWEKDWQALLTQQPEIKVFLAQHRTFTHFKKYLTQDQIIQYIKD